MTIRITSSEAALAATPYLFGFTPADSLVLLLSDPGGMRGSLRLDLPDEPDLAWLQSILAGVPHPVPTNAILITYADSFTMEFAAAMADWVMASLTPALDVLDSVIVHEGRMHSLFTSMTVGENETGQSLTELVNHPVVAECVAEGLSKVGSRAELERILDFLEDEVSEEVAELLEGQSDWGHHVSTDVLEVRALAVLRSATDLAPLDVLHVGFACRDIYARDPMITLLLEEPDRLHAVRDRLAYCIAHLPDDLAGPTAATLALLSWSGGDGAAALVAAVRAMNADPGNTLAPLVADALQHGLPADTWSTLTRDIPMDVLRGRDRRSA